ncbi:RmlC-like jelly roll fold [Cinara cedri]|uniref:RmlC-like jelly roll fold n=1 Tax=Cinara cedri TaxID=506608 RepID=A0A5E4MLV1_9HEMI|nr:RmlC-like jelly roll fold [Cinara cedri]
MEAFRRAAKRVADRTDDQQLDCALMASVQKQLTEVADAVAAVRPLAELPDPERRECAKTSAVKRYAARSVVYGEKRPGRLVVATTEVRCLLVPLAFLAKHNASNIWGRTVCALDASEPTAEQSFRKFVVDNRWEEYKRSLAAEILGNRDRPSPSRPPWRR